MSNKTELESHVLKRVLELAQEGLDAKYEYHIKNNLSNMSIVVDKLAIRNVREWFNQNNSENQL